MNSPRHTGLFGTALSVFSFLFWCSVASAQVEIVENTVASGDFVLTEGRVNYKFTIQGARTGGSQNEARVAPYWYMVYATGLDMYGNRFYQLLEQGQTNELFGRVTGENGSDPTRQSFEGSWTSGDPTLINFFPLKPSAPQKYSAHQIVFVLYGDGVTASQGPVDDAAFAAPAQRRAEGEIYWYIPTNLGPDLQIDGVTYNAGTYEGGDVIRMTTTWRNRIFPLGGSRGEIYKVHNMLTENASVDWRPPADPNNPPDAVVPDNDDFLLTEYTMLGDQPVVSPADLTPVIPDGSTIVRTVEVVGTPGPLLPYGIPNLNPLAVRPFYDSTLRLYQPQPDDGWLDIGEAVSVTVEVLVPQNYAGTYFVAARLDPDNKIPEPVNVRSNNTGLFAEITPGQPDNNTFVSNASAKITIDGPTPAPRVDPVSAITSDDGEYIQGGGETSNYSAITADGNRIAFSSAARNLLVPPTLAKEFIRVFGRGRDMTESPTFSIPSEVNKSIGDYLTFNQQIFYRLRQTGEIYLASGNQSGLRANADCFNPSMNSAGGRYIAYDSRANNLGVANPGNRSFIYITDTQTQNIVTVSRAATGALANGDCFNPALSANGRFVVFESVATNLDPAKSLPVANATRQIYLHDRNVDGRVDSNNQPIFDIAGNTATYLVSVDISGKPANGNCITPVINAYESNGTMHVAFVSTAASLLSGGIEQVYRISVNISGASRGALPATLELVSKNTNGVASNRPAGAPNGSIEPSISGDGSQIAFSSSANNLVYNPDTFGWDGDTNLVPDVFVRNLKIAAGDPAYTLFGLVRVSESNERVATGTIIFSSPAWIRTPQPGGTPFANTPVANNPANGTVLRITGLREVAGQLTTNTVTFNFVNTPPATLYDIEIGPNVQATRDRLVQRINALVGELGIRAYATTPPTAPPGTAYNAAIYLRNVYPTKLGNVDVTTTSPALVVSGMAGGGVQAEDAVLAVQGVPAGSNQPSISEDGRIVAFRSIAGNLDVNKLTADNDFGGGPPYEDKYQPSPRQGELIRPSLFPASNIYVRNRQVDPGLGDFDQGGNISTTKVSANKFGYPTTVNAQQGSGLGAFTTAANQAPVVGGNGRYISFSSGSEIYGGLAFGRNNLEPLDFQNARDVYIYDSQVVGIDPPPTESRPMVVLNSPGEGLTFLSGSTISLAASATAKLGKTIKTVQFFVNGVAVGAPLTAEPYAVTYRLDNPGYYAVRVVATDSRDVSSAATVFISAVAPGSGGAPGIVVTHPVPAGGFDTANDFSRPSELFLNAVVTGLTGSSGAGIATPKFFANGQQISGSVTSLSNSTGVTYGVKWSPPSNGTYNITAQVSTLTNSNNPVSITAVSDGLSFLIGEVARPLPTINLLPIAQSNVALGSSVVLQARIGTDLTPIDRVDFYANQVLIGSAVPAPIINGQTTIAFAWQPPSTNTYTLAARAQQVLGEFDNSVISANSTNASDYTMNVTANSNNTAPPIVTLAQQPIADGLYVEGSSLFFNVSVTPNGTNSVSTNTNAVSFYFGQNRINAQDSRLGQGNTRIYSAQQLVVSGEPSRSLFASAMDSQNVVGSSAIRDLTFTPPLYPLPEVEMLPIDPLAELGAGTTLELQALARFPATASQQSRVEFYVNGAFVGFGIADAAARADGFTIYRYAYTIPDIRSSQAEAVDFSFQARAVALNFQTNTGEGNARRFYGSVISGAQTATGYFVPSQASNGSNEQFVLNYFQKLFFRAPTYNEFQYYLGLLNDGQSQSQVIVAMAQSEAFNDVQGVLFGYYIRMGMRPASYSQVTSFVTAMTNVNGRVLLSPDMSAGISNVSIPIPPPYGATVGQASVAAALINSNTNRWTNNLVPKSMDPTTYMQWMQRSFNSPYLTNATTNTGAIGNQTAIINTIASFPSTNSSVVTRYGHTYAYMSALYAVMPPSRIASTNLVATLSNFPPYMQSVAVNYLLSPTNSTNSWRTNLGPISPTNITPLLAPVISNTGTNVLPFNSAYSLQITGQNFVSNTTRFSGSNLPAGLTINTNSGLISGTPTNSLVYTSSITASNGPAAVGTSTLVFDVLPAAPTPLGKTIRVVVGEQATDTVNVLNVASGFSISPSVSWVTVSSNGSVTVQATNSGTNTFTVSAFNRGGTNANSLVIEAESALASYLRRYHTLTGDARLPSSDVDGDGHTLTTEFAFGMNPTLRDAAPVSITASDGQIHISWTRRKTTDSVVRYLIKESPALGSLAAVWINQSPARVPQVVQDIDASYERVRVSVPVSGLGLSRFFRVEAEVQPGAF